MLRAGDSCGQTAISGKNNKIPTVCEFPEHLDFWGFLTAADALNCQKDTARVILSRKEDYLLCIKDNQENLKKRLMDMSRMKCCANLWNRNKNGKKQGADWKTNSVCHQQDQLEVGKRWVGRGLMHREPAHGVWNKRYQEQWMAHYIASWKLTAKEYCIISEWNGVRKRCAGY